VDPHTLNQQHARQEWLGKRQVLDLMGGVAVEAVGVVEGGCAHLGEGNGQEVEEAEEEADEEAEEEAEEEEAEEEDSRQTERGTRLQRCGADRERRNPGAR